MKLSEMGSKDKIVQCDARYLICPLPVLKARRMLLSMAQNDQLLVLSTDLKSPSEFALFCQDEGYQLISTEKNGDVYHITVLKV